FEKFPQADPVLTTQMKSVGEAMAIGRTFKEALQKAVRSLEVDSYGFEPKVQRFFPTGESQSTDISRIKDKLRIPNDERLWYIADAFRTGMAVEEIQALTKIDPWFL